MESVVKTKATPDLLRRMAQLLTGHKGSEALNRFGKLLVVGAARNKGFEDKQNDNVRDLFDHPWVRLGHFSLLTRFSFKEGKRYQWDFASGVSEGQHLDGFASSKGRMSKWVGTGAKKLWEENGITGVVLVGMAEDVEFFYVGKDEFLAMDKDRLSFVVDGLASSEELVRWKHAWEELVFQPTFGALLGGGE
jgi:hypothetical protein